jgi:transcriptional regulator with XRE-family HTH domain
MVETMAATTAKKRLNDMLRTRSLSQFAKDHDLSRTSLYNFMGGDRTPTIATLKTLSIALNVPLRLIVLEEYCGGTKRAIGPYQRHALATILETNSRSKFHGDFLTYPDRPVLLTSLQGFEQRGIRWEGRFLSIADLCLAAYLYEMPI